MGQSHQSTSSEIGWSSISSHLKGTSFKLGKYSVNLQQKMNKSLTKESLHSKLFFLLLLLRGQNYFRFLNIKRSVFHLKKMLRRGLFLKKNTPEKKIKLT